MKNSLMRLIDRGGVVWTFESRSYQPFIMQQVVREPTDNPSTGGYTAMSTASGIWHQIIQRRLIGTMFECSVEVVELEGARIVRPELC